MIRLLSVPVALASYLYGLWSIFAFTVFLLNGQNYLPVLSAIFPYAIDDDNTSAGSMTDKTINNTVFFGLWAFFHSLCARPSFKKIFNLPKEVERPFYCLQSGFFLHQALKNWQSMPAVIFVAPQILKIFMMGWYAFGVFWLLTSTFAIDHFELFGLRQGLGMGKFLRFVPDGFVTIFHYRLVRHPIMTGFFIMLFSIVEFTAGRVFLSLFVSSYIMFAIKYLEEPNLLAEIGETYEKYMKTTPAFIPFLCPFSSKVEKKERQN